MELPAGHCTRVFECFDQLGGSFVASAIEFVRIFGVLVRLRGSSDHEEGRTFEENDLSGAACLCEGGEMF